MVSSNQQTLKKENPRKLFEEILLEGRQKLLPRADLDLIEENRLKRTSYTFQRSTSEWVLPKGRNPQNKGPSDRERN